MQETNAQGAARQAESEATAIDEVEQEKIPQVGQTDTNTCAQQAAEVEAQDDEQAEQYRVDNLHRGVKASLALRQRQIGHGRVYGLEEHRRQGHPDHRKDGEEAVRVEQVDQQGQAERHQQQEGAIQIFHEPYTGVEEIIVGVVGVLQLEVLEYRLKNEYGVDVRRRSLPFEVIRWIDNEGLNPNDLNLTSDTKWVQDFKGNNLLLFTSEWCVNWALNKNEGLMLREFNKD